MIDILDYHQSVIADYQNYIKSFIRIEDDKIRETVNKALSNKLLWRDPLIQFNPGYQSESSFGEMAESGLLHSTTAEIFPYTPHKHQEDAIRLGVQGKHFVVISGTGSGKSLTYLATIFDFLLKKNGTSPKPGVNALIVYPMNALINSQFGEIEKFQTQFEEKNGKGSFPFTFDRYTGQENDEKKRQIIERKPNIILTNYVMLELMLVRAKERDLRQSIFQDLNFLVFDEMHTYRGRQGADVAVLIRRIQREANNKNLVCIGTSATMSSSDNPGEQKSTVAEVASRFFGVAINPEQVVTETLRQVITEVEPSQDLLRDFLAKPIHQQSTEKDLVKNPLAAWLEQYVALEKREGAWHRRKPQSLPEVIEALVAYSGVSSSECEARLKEILNLIQFVNLNLSASNENKSYLQFRLHQFFLQTGAVYCTIEPSVDREVTLEKESESCVKNGEKLPWFSVVFSRLTGEPFYRVNQVGADKLKPWSDVIGYEIEEEPGEEGYLLLSPLEGEDFWDDNTTFIQEALPAEWFDARNRERIKPEKRKFLPRRVYVNKYGDISGNTKDGFLPAWFLLAPLQFDPTIGAFFDPRTNENTKLARIGNEGRSTATTTIALSAILALHRLGEPRKVQKVLSFTDNRQDAALQAGHFNDFVRTILLRSAIYDAVVKNGRLDFSNIDQQTIASLGLAQDDYARNPSPLTSIRSENERALRLYIFYKIMEDLRRGWRVVLPNLEQCALLHISYVDLDELASQEHWTGESKMNECPTEQRREIIFQLLEYMRSWFAISASNYEKQVKEQNEAIIAERLKDPWKFDTQERIFEPSWVRVESSSARATTHSLHYLSAWGKYLKDIFQRQGHNDFRGERVNDLTKAILETLASLGYLTKNVELDKDQPLYRLPVTNVLWLPGDGRVVTVDKVRLRSTRDIVLQPNDFFKDFYSKGLDVLKYRLAGEHTGQLKNDRRQFNEKAFRHDDDVPYEKRLAALFCSPTMELGIDISELNTVHMRNVPPSPANYVQRSGRAGRSGQGALVLTYCGNQSPHDRYYFQNPKEMVAGIVTPPNLDLSNEELWTTHLHSMFLAACSLEEFDRSVAQILDIEKPGYPLKPEVATRLQLQLSVVQLLVSNAQVLLRDATNLNGKPWWFTNDWVSKTIEKAPEKFDRAFDRWRNLYQNAIAAKNAANQILNHPHISKSNPEYRIAKREFDNAQEQMELLRNTGNAEQSEFFPFRYLASEGFMPGYNFPRLPRRVVVETSSTGGDFISRPRLLALTEFGPQNTIYYDGQKYQVYRMNLPLNEGLPLRSAKVSKKSGFILMDKDYNRDSDPFSGADLSKNENVTDYKSLLELQDGRAMLMQRISCEEEERQRKGYDEAVYFRTDHPEVQKLVKVFAYGELLLNLRYLPAAQIVKVNHKWRASKAQVQGFPIHKKTGKWLSQKEVDDLNADPNTAELSARVNLFSHATANALYIEPCAKLNLSPDGVKTMMYALKRAVELHFQIEPREIAATIMGDREQPNIFLYEATEGSLGVLSQIVLDVSKFREVAQTAYHLCHFKDGKDTHKDGELCAASYADLLDYYNQRDHSIINRHFIKGAMELLLESNFDNSSGGANYEEHYQTLRSASDPNSDLERQLLDYLYSKGLRLPDRAQVSMSKYGCYTSADFIFEKQRIAIFVDGSVHDQTNIVAEDDSKRECLERLGWEVLIWHYRKPAEAFVQQYPNIFTKARI